MEPCPSLSYRGTKKAQRAPHTRCAPLGSATTLELSRAKVYCRSTAFAALLLLRGARIGKAYNPAGNSCARIANRLAAVVNLGVDYDTPPDNWILLS